MLLSKSVTPNLVAPFVLFEFQFFTIAFITPSKNIDKTQYSHFEK